MDGINQMEASCGNPQDQVAEGKLDEPFDFGARSLTTLLRYSTIGVALFDRNLECKSANAALCSMIGMSAAKHRDKQFHQIFPGRIPKIEAAFRRVWNSGSSLSNLELSAKSHADGEPRRWLVNFYPIRNESGQVQLVAATFSEVTKGRWVEMKLSRLRDKFHSDFRSRPSVLAQDFSALSERTFEIVHRSATLLRHSLSLRFHISEMLIEAALVRHALFMNASRQQESAVSPQPSLASGIDTTSTPESCDDTKLASHRPSPRERQILHLLADGKSNKEIGSVLDISTRTVECYRARIMIKLDLHSTAALVRYAIRNKIIEA